LLLTALTEALLLSWNSVVWEGSKVTVDGDGDVDVDVDKQEAKMLLLFTPKEEMALLLLSTRGALIRLLMMIVTEF